MEMAVYRGIHSWIFAFVTFVPLCLLLLFITSRASTGRMPVAPEKQATEQAFAFVTSVLLWFVLDQQPGEHWQDMPVAPEEQAKKE